MPEHVLDQRQVLGPLQGAGGKEKGIEKRCACCPHNPENLFMELDDLLIQDIPGFFRRLDKIIKDGPGAISVGGCRLCRKTTFEDAIYLQRISSELGKSIIYEGFRIVL